MPVKQTHAPPLPKVSQPRDDIRLLVQPLVDPPGNLPPLFSPAPRAKTPAVSCASLTTFVVGYFVQKFFSPSGDAI